MGKIDREQERARLAARYAAMSDLELLKVGQNPITLTDLAFEALREEMAKRGLDWAGKDLPLPSQMVPPEKQENDGNTPVVIRQYRDMPVAMTDRMILEAAGIECYLYDENMVRLDWLWSNLLGGLKLVVRQRDAEDADRALSSAPNEKFDVEGVGEYQQERCPNCGSMDVFCDELKKRIAGAGLLLGVPIAMHQKGWNCHHCGHIWEAASEDKTGSAKQ
jgi:ribosomal protein S27AE